MNRLFSPLSRKTSYNGANYFLPHLLVPQRLAIQIVIFFWKKATRCDMLALVYRAKDVREAEAAASIDESVFLNASNNFLEAQGTAI
jgi:hypothetical protein